jgi:hypothetical protein
MRRRKPSKLNAIVQVNLRIDEQLRRQLEADAKEHHVTFIQEVRLRLTKGNQSLASYVADFTRRVRDTVEHSARKEDIETTWGNLRALDAKFAHLYTDVEQVLTPYLRDPKVRELIRGAPILPDETKPTQQRKGKGRAA